MALTEGSKLKITLRQGLLIVIIVAAVLILPGSDVYTHIHEAWLYNHMIKNRAVLTKDPSLLSGQQQIYDRSIPAYVLAGLGWFLFQKSVIKILEALLFLGLVAISLRLFTNSAMLYFWYALVFVKVIMLDEYPYLLSFFLFYLGVYFIKKYKEKPFGGLAVMLAGINHPYIAATNVITLFFGRPLLFFGSIVILLFQFVIVKFIFFAGLVNFDFYNVIDFVGRSLVLFFPIIYNLLPKSFSNAVNLKTAYVVAIGGLVVSYPVMSILFSAGIGPALSCYYTKTYNEIPNLEGNVRIVDDCRTWTYVFPLRGIISSQSNEFEGQYYHTKWTEKKYLSYLIASRTAYVVFCKNCEKSFLVKLTGELPILERNFPIYLETRDYVIFDVRAAEEKYASIPADQHKNRLTSFIKNLSHIVR